MPLQLCASEWEDENNFRARGSAQVLEKAQNGQGKSKENQAFSWIVFARAWPDLAGFG
jgi:hypothetical protein